MTNDVIMTGDGCRIAYRFDGPQEAPVLLLSNSLGTSMGMWDPQMASWTQRFRVLRYDQRGHGRSASPAGAYSMDRLGRDIIEMLDLLGLERAHFCGLSLGGMMGQWLGIRAPERIAGLVLANTSSYMGPPGNWDARIATVRDQGMAPLASASVERWFTASFRAGNPGPIDAITDLLLATDPGGYAGCCAAIRDMDMRKCVALIERSALVIGGTLDPSTPPPHSAALVESIAGARLVMLEAAHLSNVERPADFAVAVADYLTQF